MGIYRLGIYRLGIYWLGRLGRSFRGKLTPPKQSRPKVVRELVVGALSRLPNLRVVLSCQHQLPIAHAAQSELQVDTHSSHFGCCAE